MAIGNPNSAQALAAQQKLLEMGFGGNAWGSLGDPGSQVRTLAGPDGQTWMSLGYDPTKAGNVTPGFEQAVSQAYYDPQYGWVAPQAGLNAASENFAQSKRGFVDNALNSGAGLLAIAGGLGALGPLSGALGGAGAAGDVSGYYGTSAPTMAEGLSGAGGAASGAVGGAGTALGGAGGVGSALTQAAAPVTDLTAPGAAAGTTNYAPGVLSGGASTAATGGGSGLFSGGLGAINSALGTNLSGTDLSRILAGAGQGLLGYLGSQAQSNAYEDVANQQAAIGAPYRNTLQASYQPGFDLMSQPGYGDAFNRIADISSRSYSAKMGNPADNPTAQAGILSDVWNQGYLPALSNYRGQLGQFGGLGLNTSGTASLAGAQQSGGAYDALGYGLGTALGGQSLTDQYLQSLLKSQGQQQKLSIGGNIYG